jgi:hypothetical protein
VSIVFATETASRTGALWLDAADPDAALLLRILAGGMDDRAVLRRLFHDALRGVSFAEAGSIVWQASRREAPGSGREFSLISSHQWLDPLEDRDAWTTEAWPDASAGS